MLELNGKYNNAKVFTNIIENSAKEQIVELCNQEFCKDNKIRIMPDVHAGVGCTIGTTMTIIDKIIPNLVGIDIGCGMLTTVLNCYDIDLHLLDALCHEIPSGLNVWENSQLKFDITKLKCYRELKNVKRLEKSLGTLGGGNHFIEASTSLNDEKINLIIHSGSRNLGKQVAEYYQNLAIELHSGKEEYFIQKNLIIESYKKAGRKNEIQEALKNINFNNKKLTIKKDLCYLYGEYLENYLYDIDICQKWAKKNREYIATFIVKNMNLKTESSWHTIHNYIDMQDMVLRKGAVSAHKDEVLLIPINMRDGSLVCKGKGNSDWNYSAPHGAGRLFSRSEARKQFTENEFKESMKYIYSTTVNINTIDECPMAYKNINDIITNIYPTVDIIDILTPIYNFKASD